MNKTIISAALCTGLLAGCKSEAPGAQGGSDAGVSDSSTAADSGGGPSGDVPAIPSAAAGEVAVVVRDQGEDTSFRCTIGTNSSAMIAMTGGAYVLGIGCQVRDEDAPRNFRLVAHSTEPFTARTYALATSSTMWSPMNPILGISVIDDGEGISVADFNGNGAVTFEGELVLDEVGEAGGVVSGSFVGSWERVPVVTGGGSANSVHDRPGSVAAAFRFTR